MLATLIIPEDVIEDLSAEVGRARTKFPNAYNLNAALMEECGELARAQMQHQHSLDPDCRACHEIRKEAIQVMAMAFRIMTEGDASLTLNDEAKQK
jgi:NTP pyrophosphatase (non-canonical NTP hydrolase)